MLKIPQLLRKHLGGGLWNEPLKLHVVERLLDQMPGILSDLVFFGCLTAGSVAGIIALVKNRGKLKSWFAENAAPKGYLRCAFTLPSVLILCVADLLMGVGWMVTMIAPL